MAKLILLINNLIKKIDDLKLETENLLTEVMRENTIPEEVEIPKENQDQPIICGAHWCNRPIVGVNVNDKVNGIRVCHSCRQHVFNKCKKMGWPYKEAVLADFPAPKKPVIKNAANCSRKGCSKKFKEGEGVESGRMHIGSLPVCKTCYQSTWEVSKQKGITLEEALILLPPKGTRRSQQRKKPKKEIVKTSCCMPWCKNTTPVDEKKQIGPELFTCGSCARYLQTIQRRNKSFTDRSWEDWGIQAMDGSISGPDTPEKCVMPWCDREITRNHKRGPHGEPICNSDGAYLYLYAKKNKVSFQQAFMLAITQKLPKGKKARRKYG